MSTPKLKNGPDDAVRIYFSVEIPSLSAGVQTMAFLIVHVGIYTSQSGRIQEGRGGHTLQVMAGRGDSEVEGFTYGGIGG